MNFLLQDKDLSISKDISILYFYSNWMPFNKKMISILNKMEERYKDASILAIDSDKFTSICKRFEINSIPTVIFFKNAKEIKRINGVVLTSAMRAVFADIYKI